MPDTSELQRLLPTIHHLVKYFSEESIFGPSPPKILLKIPNNSLLLFNIDCQSQVPFSAVSGASEDYENETFVWGTTIRAQKVSRDFVHFFELFIEEGGFEAKYLKLMREVSPTSVQCRPRYCYDDNTAHCDVSAGSFDASLCILGTPVFCYGSKSALR